MKIIEKAFLFFCLTLTADSYAINPYSTKELDELEKEFVQQINLADGIERDPLTTYYINELGNRLARASNQPKPHFFIVKSNEINAFAGPGGHIGINTRLILTTDSESELAAVMAHELAHVRLHHLYYMIQHEKRMRIPMIAALLASIALSAIDPTLASAAAMASMTGFAQDNINFVRAGEKEADRIGIQMLAAAGFNPQGMVSFFKKMQMNSRYSYTDNFPAILRTHPLDQDRIAEAENRIASLSLNKPKDPLDYQLVKVIIATSSSSINQNQLQFYQKNCKLIQPYEACRYGLGLTYLHLNKFQEAENILSSLVEMSPDNVFYQLAMAEAEAGNKHFDKAISRLSPFYLNDPDNYAVLRTYSHTMVIAGETDRAMSILLKAFRRFKTDLPLCEALSRAQYAAKQKNYAYFTDAQCLLLQGRIREAARQLRHVIANTKKDPYLSARASAMLDDVKAMNE